MPGGFWTVLFLVDRKRDDAGARRTLSKLGIDIDVGLKIVDLTSNLKQFVEIAREIDRSDLQLLILMSPRLCSAAAMAGN